MDWKKYGRWNTSEIIFDISIIALFAAIIYISITNK